MLILLALLISCAVVSETWAYRGKKSKSRAAESELDYKANDMLRKGIELLEMKQEERAVKLISSVPRIFPKSKVKFNAYMVLGKHYQEKRNYELAVKQFQQLEATDNQELLAESLYHTGICYYNISNFDKAFMILRKVTNEFPWTIYANESFYYIGLCHFKLGHWAKAVEALEMVGTSVPANVSGKVYCEAGQRFYIKIFDKDLVVFKESGEPLNVAVTTVSGDREVVTLQLLGRSGEYYLGSIPTTPGKAKPGDGLLQIIGSDIIKVGYVDQNTEAGMRNKKLLSTVQMVSTASIGFTDGAYREYTHGVFGDSDCFIRIKDLDRDKTDACEKIRCRLFARYKIVKKRDESLQGIDLSGDEEEEEEIKIRDRIMLTLSETGGHSGIFVGKCKPIVVTDSAQIHQGDNTLAAMNGDVLVLEYEDAFHINGNEPRSLTAEAKLLIGVIQDVKIEHREVELLEIKARKQLIEGKIFLKLASIFKEVGLNKDAYENADEGLDRVDDIIHTSLKVSLDRSIVEEAFSIKWDLLLAKDKLSEAIAVCNTLTQLFPDSTLVDQALLKIGLAKMDTKDWESWNEAASIFSSILRLKRSNLKAEAAYHIAEVYEKRAMAQAATHPDREPNLSHAMLAYKKCAENYPDSSFACDALDKIINFYLNK